MALARDTPAPHRPRSVFIRSHRALPAPIVVLGMHRSGTSILTRMLQACGVYIGPTLDRNFEDVYLRGLNKRLLERAGATWYEPEPYLQRREEPEFRAAAVRDLETALADRFVQRYLRWRRVLAPGASFPWGWKDPRTCLTLDVWLEVFPEARVVHVARHPLAVALSLQRREEQRREKGREACPPVTDLRHNLQLWETYVRECCRFRRLGDRYHELRYEALAADPRRELEAVLAACRLEPPAARRAAAAALMDPHRAAGYREERHAAWRAEAAALAHAREFGYD